MGLMPSLHRPLLHLCDPRSGPGSLPSFGVSAAAVNCVAVMGTVPSKPAAPKSEMPDALIATGILVLTVSVLIVLAAVAKKLLSGRQARFDLGDGFTIADLRQLRADGKISETEYALAKASVAARERQALLDDDPQSRGRDATSFSVSNRDRRRVDSDNDAAAG